MAAGIDSLGATELQRALSEQLGTELEATLLFDHPSAGGIVSLLTASVSFEVSPPCTAFMPMIESSVAPVAAEAQVATPNGVLDDPLREAPHKMKAVYASRDGGDIEWRDLQRPMFF